MSEWQPIETAPKGVNVLIAWTGYSGQSLVGEAYYGDDPTDAGWWWANTDPGDYYASAISPEPTHWMPLPEPPK